MHRILIVEDVSETRSWLEEIVRSAFSDCRIVMAASMGGGLRAAEDEKFEIALIDLGLPDGSGLEVL